MVLITDNAQHFSCVDEMGAHNTLTWSAVRATETWKQTASYKFAEQIIGKAQTPLLRFVAKLRSDGKKQLEKRCCTRNPQQIAVMEFALKCLWHCDVCTKVCTQLMFTTRWLRLFLQRGTIACYAKRCTSYRKSVCPSVRPSVTVGHCV